MKHLSDYVNESRLLTEEIILEDINGDIIAEGFWSKLSQIFGFGSEKVKKSMKNWKKELRAAFIAGQMAAARGDDKMKDAIKKQDAAAEKGTKELLEQTKIEVHRLMKNWDHIKTVDYSFAQWAQLSNLSKQENDSEGTELAKKFKKIIDDKFPDGGKNYKKTVEKIDKSGVAKTEETKEDKHKEVSKEDVDDAISSNKNVLEPLIKALNGKINSDKLTELIEDLMKKDPAYKGSSDAATMANTIGMASVICGAAMITSKKCLNRVGEWVIDNMDSLKKIIKADEVKLNKPEK